MGTPIGFLWICLQSDCYFSLTLDARRQIEYHILYGENSAFKSRKFTNFSLNHEGGTEIWRGHEKKERGIRKIRPRVIFNIKSEIIVPKFLLFFLMLNLFLVVATLFDQLISSHWYKWRFPRNLNIYIYQNTKRCTKQHVKTRHQESCICSMWSVSDFYTSYIIIDR